MFIGFDGGGTKTAMVLVDRDGVVKSTHVTSGSYYLALGVDALGQLIEEGVGQLLRAAGIRPADVQFAFFGLPAFGEESSVTEVLSQLPGRCLPAGTYLCGNDMVCGWAGSLLCRDGISVVAGTGSICYGERSGASSAGGVSSVGGGSGVSGGSDANVARGAISARSGGWGEIFSDEGSAYWLACRGLNLFSRMSDGRSSKGPLYELLRQRLSLQKDLDLCGHIYSQLAGDRARIAQFGNLVTEAAALGDAQAQAILGEGATELALLVHAVRRQLGFDDSQTVPVSYSGGVFDNAGASFRDLFAGALQRYGVNSYRVCTPELSPVLGAALYAAKQAGQPLSAAAIDRMRAGR